MAIKLTCPKGHALTCPDELAGKPGKCPDCGSKFIVPVVGGKAEAITTEASTAGFRKTGDSGKSRSASAPAGGSGPSLAEDEIVFLCPNGHKLNGPSSLQGRPGQCPHCGAKFRIPTREEMEGDGEAPDDDVPMGEAVDVDVFVPPATLDEISPHADEPEYGAGANLDAITAADAYRQAPPAAAGSFGGLASAFAWLWDQRGPDGVVDVFIEGGDVVTPDYFSSSLSTADCLVVAVADDDGTYTLAAVPWRSVKRVGFRRVRKLPPRVFN
jgi:Zn finger protein HypA/HybF involved in hydrogenase expression